MNKIYNDLEENGIYSSENLIDNFELKNLKEEFNIDELDRMYVRQKVDDYPKYQSEPRYINNEKDRKAIMFWRGQESEVFTL